MFTLAMEAKRTRDMGVVGSTSNILDFIATKVKCALEQPFADKLQVPCCLRNDILLHACYLFCQSHCMSCL